MKKIIIKSDKHLQECMSKLKELGYTYTFGASENVKFIILEGKKMRFEYGDDVYECEEFSFIKIDADPRKSLVSFLKQHPPMAAWHHDAVSKLIKLAKAVPDEAN